MIGDNSERDEITLRFLAIADNVTYAQARREAFAAYAKWIRDENPWLAKAVEGCLDYRREHTAEVIPLRGAL